MMMELPLAGCADAAFIMNGMEPLWMAKDQAKRLAELTAGTADPEKEAPLRRDVRSLGVLLGRVLVEQGGEKLLESVEELRRLLIQQREEDAGERRRWEQADGGGARDCRQDGIGRRASGDQGVRDLF